MKAIIQNGYGGPEVLQVGERSLPVLESDEVLIKVDYAGVNRAETLQRKGLYPPPPGATDVLGLECAGRLVLNPDRANTIEELLSEKRYIALLSGGGYAQYAKVCKDHIIEVPSDQDFEKVASVTEVWATAYQILHFVSNVQAGEFVLIHAAASGVGTAMIQLAKAAGAITIAVSSQDSKLEVCKQLGADFTINYTTYPDFQTEVQKITQGKGANVIADPVGASNAARNVASLAVDGRWVLYGSMGGRIVENFDLGALVAKRGALLTTTLKTRSKDYKKSLLSELSKVFFNSGHKFETVIEKVLPMSAACDAHALMESNTTVGKILLKYDLSN